jgi:hypothetical protein
LQNLNTVQKLTTDAIFFTACGGTDPWVCPSVISKITPPIQLKRGFAFGNQGKQGRRKMGKAIW